MIAVGRIENFLNEEELDPNNIQHTTSNGKNSYSSISMCFKNHGQIFAYGDPEANIESLKLQKHRKE